MNALRLFAVTLGLQHCGVCTCEALEFCAKQYQNVKLSNYNSLAC